MRDGMTMTRIVGVVIVLVGAVALCDCSMLQALTPTLSTTQPPAAHLTAGGQTPPPPPEADVIAPGWQEFPSLPVFTHWDQDALDFRRISLEEYGLYKAVPAPDGGIYLFVNSLVSDGGSIYVEQYDADLNFVTAPTLGLRLLGITTSKISAFDVVKSGDFYYVAVQCNVKSPNTIVLTKYDKDFNLVYSHFIDVGWCPSIVVADGKVQVLYVQSVKINNQKTRRLFAMTVIEAEHNIDGKKVLFVRKSEKTMLETDGPLSNPGPTYSAVAYNPTRKEFCVAYVVPDKSLELEGKGYVQLYDEQWKSKGAAVSVYDNTKTLRGNDKVMSMVPSVTFLNNNYYVAIDQLANIRKTGIPWWTMCVGLLKMDKDLKLLGAEQVYGKMPVQGDPTRTGSVTLPYIFPYDNGLGLVANITHGSAVLYKMDAAMKVSSGTILKGGFPRAPDLFVDAATVQAWPPKGIMGAEQVIVVPVNNIGWKAGRCTVSLYYEGNKVATQSITNPIPHGRARVVQLKWTVPDNLQQDNIDVQIKVEPGAGTTEYTLDNNTVTLTLPVWDKGIIRGYLCDGSLGAIDWFPLQGAKVTITAPGFTAEATTDKIGYYEFDRVPFGNCHIKIQRENYNTVEADRVLRKQFPVVTYRDKLNNHGTIEVTVAPDKAAGNCEVLFSSDKYDNIDTEKVGGKYVADVPVGAYKVQINAPGFLRYTQENIEVNLGQTTSLSPTLEEATSALVHGSVCDEYGDPIGGASVTFVQDGWDDKNADCPRYTVQADETGNFTIELTGYEKKTEDYTDADGNVKTRIVRGDKMKGAVRWTVTTTAPKTPGHVDAFSGRTGYEEYCEIYLCDPAVAPKKIGVIQAYVPWTASANFPGYLTYPELNAYAWYGLFATGVTADYNPKRNELISLYVGVQGLAYEAHGVSGKFSSVSEPKSTGWKKWGTYAWRVGSRLWKLKNTAEDEPEKGDEVPTIFSTVCDVVKENVGKTLFIPGVDDHLTSVRVDLIQVLSTEADNKDAVLWSDNQQWYSHSSPNDEAPNTHLRDFRLPRGFFRNKTKVVVYLKLQKLGLDGQTPDGLVPFYTNQYIKLVWHPDSNDMKAYYVPEYTYRHVTGLDFE